MTRIGVTGHRRYRGTADTDEAIAVVIARVTDDGVPPTIISSLAEGADRAIAERVLELPGASLEVVLPMHADDYSRDFESNESRRHFARLIATATRVDVVAADGDGGPSDGLREGRYERAGHEVVDRCDVLIAVWDGTPARGRGGTADIIQYALDHDVRVEIVLVDREP